jgi:hypothetical protein
VRSTSFLGIVFSLCAFGCAAENAVTNGCACASGAGSLEIRLVCPKMAAGSCAHLPRGDRFIALVVVNAGGLRRSRCGSRGIPGVRLIPAGEYYVLESVSTAFSAPRLSRSRPRNPFGIHLTPIVDGQHSHRTSADYCGGPGGLA